MCLFRISTTLDFSFPNSYKGYNTTTGLKRFIKHNAKSKKVSHLKTLQEKKFCNKKTKRMCQIKFLVSYICEEKLAKGEMNKRDKNNKPLKETWCM